MIGPIIKSGLAPLVCANARTLILGSLPGDVSLHQQQYYAHPQNQFWRVIAACFDVPTPDTYSAKIALLRNHNIAVWDVLASAERPGSLDSAIRSASPNTFAKFFADNRSITRIAFNGQRAHALFARHVTPELPSSRYQIAVLPSTSPAATRPFIEKLALWRAFLRSEPSNQ